MSSTQICVGCDAIGRMFCDVCLDIHKEKMLLNPEYKLAHERAIEEEIQNMVQRYEQLYHEEEPRVEEPDFSEEELEAARQRLLEIGRRVKRETEPDNM